MMRHSRFFWTSDWEVASILASKVSNKDVLRFGQSSMFGNSLHITPMICICGFSIHLLHMLLMVFLIMPVPINNVGTSSWDPKISFGLKLFCDL